MDRGLPRAILAGAMLLVAAARLPAQSGGVVTGRVVAAGDDAPLAGVEVRAVGVPATAFTDDDGRYALPLPAGTHELRAELVGWAPARRTVAVTAGAVAGADFRLERVVVPIDALVVVGTRGPGRAAADAAAPVDIVTAADLAATGRVETRRALERWLPSFAAGARWPGAGACAAPGSVPGCVPDPGAAVGSAGGASLRGVPGARTAVLVDGRRPWMGGASTAAAMLDAIPLGAIERVEVLRSGASALYGSGAAAGALNVVLRRDPGGTLWSHVGERYDGAAAVVAGGASAGVALGERASVWAAVELWDRVAGGGVDSAGGDAGGDPGAGATPAPGGAPGEAGLGDGAARPGAQGVSALLHGSLAVGGVELFGIGTVAVRRAEGWDGSAAEDAPQPWAGPGAAWREGVGAADAWQATTTLGARGHAARWRWEAAADFGGRGIAVDGSGARSVRWGAVDVQAFRRISGVAPWPVGVAIGVQVRREHAGLAGGEGVGASGGSGARPGGAGTGAESFTGEAPAAGEAARWGGAVFGSVEVDAGRRWSALVAGRADGYGGVGAAPSAYAAARFEATRWLALRGWVGAGFRAPPVEAGPRAVARQSVGGGTARIGVAGAAPGFERSREAGAGIVLTPDRGWMATVDGYRVDVVDGIAASVVPGGDGASVLANALDTRTVGVDVAVVYGAPLAGGALRVRGAASWAETRVVRVAAVPGWPDGFLDPAAIGRIEGARPGVGTAIGASWERGPLRLALHDRSIGSRSTDITASYTVRGRLALGAGALDLFDDDGAYFLRVAVTF
ncbi:MAG TPA: TonB-dependent receptor [Longimicrobiales bacterium]